MNKYFLPPKSDVVFKLLFSDERNLDLLTDLLKSILNLSDYEYEEITLVDPHLLREFKDDKLGILDVKAKTKSGEIINIEIQVANTPLMIPRLIFYNSKMVTEQIGNGEDYDSIKKVVSIVITDFDFVKNSKSYHHCFTHYDKSNDIELTDITEIHTLELTKLPQMSDKTELWNWLKFLKSERKEELDMIAQSNPQIGKAVGVLMEMSQDEKTRMLYESREKLRRDEAVRLKGAKLEGKIEGMLSMGATVELIAEKLGLPLEKVKQLSAV